MVGNKNDNQYRKKAIRSNSLGRFLLFKKDITGNSNKIFRMHRTGKARKDASIDIKVNEIPDGKLFSLSEIAKVSKYSREYLGYLVRQKKLKAKKIDGEWKTTKK